MAPVGVLMVGAGEYTVGYVPTAHGAASDKPAGVVALSCFELRRQGLVGRIVLCDMFGKRMPRVRETVQRKIGDVYAGLDTTLECFPEDHVDQEPLAYLRAMATMVPGDVVIIFVPDDLHAEVAEAAVRHRLHVLLAKPAVKTFQEHQRLAAAVRAAGVLACVEFHKRFDPMYSDARNRARQLGPFSHFCSHMSQPKQQLDTFRAWAGLRSDISYYLNSHHIDLHCWIVGQSSRPERVVAMAATGVAQAKLGRPCEDTITLMVQWRNLDLAQEGVGMAASRPPVVPVRGTAEVDAASEPTEQGGSAGSAAAAPVEPTRLNNGVVSGGVGSSLGTAVYTASWVATKGDCHTQQGFRYSGHRGELRVDQAHRGYDGATDEGGFASYNPLYMRYTPDANGRFAGQSGYGFVSIARFVEAAAAVNAGTASVEELRRQGELALLEDSLPVTAILHAGRMSLDAGGAPVRILYGSSEGSCGGPPLAKQPAQGVDGSPGFAAPSEDPQGRGPQMPPLVSPPPPQQQQQQLDEEEEVHKKGQSDTRSSRWGEPVGLQVEGL